MTKLTADPIISTNVIVSKKNYGNDIMAIFERGESVFHQVTLRDTAEALTDPSSVSITITSPCDTVLVNSASMASSSSGVYSYSYLLSDTAVYGEYDIVVKAIDGADTSTFTEKFFVLPWNIIDEIRIYSQQTKKKISDADVALIAWNSFKEVIQRIAEYHYHEKLCRCVDGTCQCSSNAECGGCISTESSPICSDGYQLDTTPIMDLQLDGNVHGCECDDALEECQNDICGIWKDGDGVCSNIAVEVVDATCGHIKVYQADCVTAIPASNEGIFVNYYSTWESYNEQLFKKAVVLLASFEIATISNLSSKKVTGCDERGRVSFTDRLWNRYITTIESISKPNIGSGR